LLPLIEQYLHSVDDCDVDTSCTITQYLKLIRHRASGKLKTTARWIRDFVGAHPGYAHDSVVSEEVCYDLVAACAGITSGTRDEPTLVFDHKTRTAPTLPHAMQQNDQHLAHMAAKRVANDVGGTGDGCTVKVD
jgi:glutamate--cysteine ligase catalytic subunit